jgi:hypothetical protein
MSPESSNKLKTARRLIEESITEPHDDVWITHETGCDELGLVGTPDAYLRLALAALNTATASTTDPSTSRVIGSHTLAANTDYYDVFGSCDFRITSGWVSADPQAVLAVRRYFGDFYGTAETPESND